MTPVARNNLERSELPKLLLRVLSVLRHCEYRTRAVLINNHHREVLLAADLILLHLQWAERAFLS